ncbi:hypothetical protein EJ05DRAFT_470643 [Pseudovirgaria hyperparasitica]|uniref:NIMA interactive protein n=1 Tax=Pseudovirgaria hyperparasitica TaxID=470096 RepID=A0A6A6VU72_9PEZI|nr:uncharacterized protein EJ05DRAFT_470643 [Pseudovirgaria hyperparasitica]KAF2753160.1 hypothetical protein EJ05DRAFT_470643 [Pseudovirgaria hyperparasitica]
MDTYNLKTASRYINNLLLARGLLRDGKPIEFAHPSKGDGGKEATMAHIINLVHDLILKRDRDQEQREDLVQTIRTLRNDSTQNVQKIERLQTRNDDLIRQVSLTQSQERSAKMALRTAESSARVLREEMIRLKATVQQVRTSCANDVRKRDVQIQRLKSHLTTQQRGNKTGLVGASITITPGITGLGSTIAGRDDEGPQVDDPEYNLKQETTEFLTQLSQSLSDENDNLIGLVRGTLSTLRELQGLPESVQLAGENLASGTSDEPSYGDMIQALPTSYDTLAIDMDSVLENLRNLLTNPNFVSIEEVEMREQQIIRLRQGWQKMESKWREAVVLMDSWRKRIMNGGDTVNIDELKIGLGLGAGLETVSGTNDISILSDEENESVSSKDVDDIEAMEEELDIHESSFEELDDEPAFDKPNERANTTDIFNIKLTRNQPVLREGSGNLYSLRDVNCAPSAPDSASASPMPGSDENASSEIDLIHNSSSKSSSPTRKHTQSRAQSKHESRIPRQANATTQAPAPARLTSREHHSSPHTSSRPTRSPKLSITDKLNAAQVSAEAAKVAEGLSASSKSNAQITNNARPSSTAGTTIEKNDVATDPIRPSSRRTTKIGGRIGGAKARRRKSTLTPEELESLMFVS